MTCAVCHSPARGYGWTDPRHGPANPGDPGGESQRWVFCSRRCQDAWCHLMEKTEGHMVDPNEMETAAMQACLRPLGEYVGSVGLQRPLADYSRDEVLTLVDVVVTAYQDHMVEEYERMASRDRPFLQERMARRSRAAAAGGLAR